MIFLVSSKKMSEFLRWYIGVRFAFYQMEGIMIYGGISKGLYHDEILVRKGKYNSKWWVLSYDRGHGYLKMESLTQMVQ